MAALGNEQPGMRIGDRPHGRAPKYTVLHPYTRSLAEPKRPSPGPPRPPVGREERQGGSHEWWGANGCRAWPVCSLSPSKEEGVRAKVLGGLEGGRPVGCPIMDGILPQETRFKERSLPSPAFLVPSLGRQGSGRGLSTLLPGRCRKKRTVAFFVFFFFWACSPTHNKQVQISSRRAQAQIRRGSV